MFRLFLVAALIVWFSGPVAAGGGRFRLYTVNNSQGYYYVGRDVFVNAQVFVTGDSTQHFSSGERVVFYVDNPRSGDVCVTQSEKTSDLGVITASCSAQTPGTISVYVHSLDRGDDSSRIVLYFYPMPTNTPAPTLVPTLVPTSTPAPLPTMIPTTLPTRQTPSPTQQLLEAPSASPSSAAVSSHTTDGTSIDGATDQDNHKNGERVNSLHVIAALGFVSLGVIQLKRWQGKRGQSERPDVAGVSMPMTENENTLPSQSDSSAKTESDGHTHERRSGDGG